MIYKIKHGDTEYKVIAGSLEAAEQWVLAHHGKTVVKVQQPEPETTIEQEIFDAVVEEILGEPDASNQD
jgi:hypothetical protein